MNGADVPELVARLTEPRWSVRRDVVAALARRGDEAVGPLCDVLLHHRDDEARIAAAVDALVASKGRVEPAVVALAAAAEPAVVADAAQILGRRRSVEGVPTLIELTRHPDDNVAVAAIEALGRIGGRAAVDVLVEVVRGGNFFRTFPALDVLGRSGDPRAVDPLAELLGDPRYAVEATRALGHTGERLALGPLVRMLGHGSQGRVRVAAVAIADLMARHAERYGDDAEVEATLRKLVEPSVGRRLALALAGAGHDERLALCRVLAVVGTEQEVSAISALLDDPALSSAAVTTLAKLGHVADEQVVLAVERGDAERRRWLVPLLAGRTEAVPVLVQCLDDADAAVRVLACEALARTGDPAAVPALFRLLEAGNPRVVQAATAALQSLGSATTEELTLRAARSDIPEVRRAALRIAAYFGYASALAPVLEALGSADERLRDAAIAALGTIDDPRALSALLAEADRDEPRTRAMAVRALGLVSADESVLDRVRRALTDPDPWVRYYACQALGRHGVPVANELAERLADDAGQVRVAAVEALANLRGEEAFAALRSAAISADADVRRAAIVGLGGASRKREALPLLLDALRSTDAVTRLVAVSALDGMGDADALAALAVAAEDADELVRNAAIDVLAGHTAKEATHALVALLRAEAPPADEPPSLAARKIHEALARATPGRIEALTTLLHRAQDHEASVFAAALARMHDDTATAALARELSSGPPPARKAAAVALGAMPSPLARDALRAATRDPDLDVRRLAELALT